MALTEIELTAPTVDALEAAGITTVGDLCQHTAGELWAIGSVTHPVLAEVRQKLAENGLHLRASKAGPAAAVAAEPGAAADGRRDPGFWEFPAAQRGRRC
jgi:DNA-directed RNA polymerase alpha subunit